MLTSIRIPGRLATRRSAEASGTRLAAQVRKALRAAPYVPERDVAIEVRDHAVCLSGMVKWPHERVAAEQAVEGLPGVHVLKNAIRVMPRVSAAATKSKILAALDDCEPSSRVINVDVDDETVTLTGTVESYTERLIAERTALSMPLARRVYNHLQIVKP